MPPVRHERLCKVVKGDVLRIYAANIGYKKRQGFAWTMSGPLSAGGAGTGTHSTTRDSNVMFEHCPSGPRMLLIVVVCAGPFPYRQLSPSPPGSLDCGPRPRCPLGCQCMGMPMSQETHRGYQVLRMCAGSRGCCGPCTCRGVLPRRAGCRPPPDRRVNPRGRPDTWSARVHS